MPSLAPWIIYPATMTLCLATYFTLNSVGVPLPWSMYVPAFLGAALVMVFERRFPHRRAWRPDGTTIANDIAYMALVQMLLPPGVAILFVLLFIEPLQSFELARLWPHAWPVWAQAMLMLLVADFFRYWLHRAAHRYLPLWQLHAVHHSPKQLYWLNVGRFHPLEKSLQMALDTLPFMLVGVGVEVIALYFVFYAVNGFFQHSNICLRFGWLNWVISSAELHRWHHSRIPEESDHNFGNNLIIWDWLFGTRYLPPDRESEDLGLLNRNYPSDLAAQLITPFVGDITKRAAALPSPPRMFHSIARTVKRATLEVLMARYYWQYWRPLARAARDPARAQAAVLRDILARHRESGFGRTHDYSHINGCDDFRARVPIQQYEDLRPWIEAQQRGEAGLTLEAPVLYARTSGTTDRPKFVPITGAALAQHRRGQRLYTYLQFRACPEAFLGPALGMVGSAVEDRTSQGVPIGSVSGTLYASMPAFIRSRYITPPEVFAIADYDVKYRTLAQIALRQSSLSYLAGANPSSFLRLQEILNKERETLIAGVETGQFADWDNFSPELQTALLSATVPLPERAATLRAISTPLTFSRVWPELRLVATWTAGSCGVALARFRRDLPSDCTVFDIGYLSTEFRGTITLMPEHTAGLPLVNEHFYEFVEREAWDRGVPVFLGLHELVEGPLYYVIVTTVSGLVRYFMNDLVTVDGWHSTTPLLHFVQKGLGVTSITGEKLYEGQFLDGMRDLAPDASFYLLLADESESRYCLFIEADVQTDFLPDALDRKLAARNVEYRDKRASGRLRLPKIIKLRAGAGDAYKQYLMSRGQREGQFKYLTVQYQRDCEFDFMAWQI